jgi:hypothetical protein
MLYSAQTQWYPQYYSAPLFTARQWAWNYVGHLGWNSASLLIHLSLIFAWCCGRCRWTKKLSNRVVREPGVSTGSYRTIETGTSLHMVVRSLWRGSSRLLYIWQWNPEGGNFEWFVGGKLNIIWSNGGNKFIVYAELGADPTDFNLQNEMVWCSLNSDLPIRKGKKNKRLIIG